LIFFGHDFSAFFGEKQGGIPGWRIKNQPGGVYNQSAEKALALE